MPTFVIHALGRPSTQVAIEQGPIRVGRDAKNQIVLGDDTVSREHAVFDRDAAGRWWVGCVSETNPIVVDGKLVSKRKYVNEGSEVMVGRGHLVIFCANQQRAAAYLGDGAAFVKTQCATCQWTGMVRSTPKKRPTCPDCGGTDLRSEGAYARDKEIGRAKEGPTSLISTAQLGAVLQKLKAAKRSRLERADGRDRIVKELGEDRPAELARGKDAVLRLFGLTFGGSVRVAWDGACFVATSTVLFPAMKVNGVRLKSSPLKHDDMIEVGSNRFRFFTE